jgi:hypothetical protein
LQDHRRRGAAHFAQCSGICVRSACVSPGAAKRDLADIERDTREAMHSMISFALASSRRFEVTLVLKCWRSSSMPGLPASPDRAGVLHHLHRAVTNWRTPVRKTMNELDSSAHSRAVTHAENYEPSVLQQRRFEARRYDETWWLTAPPPSEPAAP